MAADRPVVSGARTDDVGSAVSRRILSGPLARAVPLLRPYRWTVAALIGLAAFGAVLQVIPDFFAGYVIDAISTRAPGSRVAGLAALATLPVLLSAAVGLAVARRSARIGEGVVYDLRQAMVASLHRQSTLFFKYASTGAVVTRLSGDATGTQRVFGPSLATVVAAGTQLTVAASATFALSWQVGRWYWRRSHCSWPGTAGRPTHGRGSATVDRSPGGVCQLRYGTLFGPGRRTVAILRPSRAGWRRSRVQGRPSQVRRNRERPAGTAVRRRRVPGADGRDLRGLRSGWLAGVKPRGRTGHDRHARSAHHPPVRTARGSDGRAPISQARPSRSSGCSRSSISPRFPTWRPPT